MEIKASSKFDFDTMKAFVHFTMFKKANPKKRLIFWTVAFSLILGVVVLEMLFGGADTILLFLLGVEIGCLFMLYFWYFFVPKIQYKSLSKMKDIENEYIFCDDKIKAFTKSQEYNSEAEIEYSLFVKVYETSRYLFLFQTNNQVNIVDKSTIEGGIIEEIRNKFYSSVKDKYIFCNY